jgi:hypothetical protein
MVVVAAKHELHIPNTQLVLEFVADENQEVKIEVLQTITQVCK